jgi:catechol 2,3-dioxygenase-like lactoylglutathione lyase family enzyme
LGVLGDAARVIGSRSAGMLHGSALHGDVTEILSVGVEDSVSPTQKIVSTGGVNSMISPEKLDYFKWQIPDGSRVRLTLIQEDDLMRGHQADGLLVVFVVSDIDREYARLQAEGVTITIAIETESWGERFFQVTDPNGVVFQLVQWMIDPIPQS